MPDGDFDAGPWACSDKYYKNLEISQLRELLEKAAEALHAIPNGYYNWGKYKNLSTWALANEIRLTLNEEVT